MNANQTKVLNYIKQTPKTEENLALSNQLLGQAYAIQNETEDGAEFMAEFHKEYEKFPHPHLSGMANASIEERLAMELYRRSNAIIPWRDIDDSKKWAWYDQSRGVLDAIHGLGYEVVEVFDDAS